MAPRADGLDAVKTRERLFEQVSARRTDQARLAAGGPKAVEANVLRCGVAGQRRKAAETLLSIADRVAAAAGIEPMSMVGINAEVKAARADCRPGAGGH